MIEIKFLYRFSDPQPIGDKKLQMFTNKKKREEVERQNERENDRNSKDKKKR